MTVETTNRDEKRLDRQFRLLEARFPRFAPLIQRVRDRRWMLLRIPLAALFIAGGFLAILPVLGLWMIPVGLMLLAVDLPFLTAPTANLIIRGRRRVEIWRRQLKR